MLLSVFSKGLIVLNCAWGAYAQVEPPGFEGSGNAISSRDRIYTGDQASNTVTVIDPSQNKVLGTIALGDERLGNDLGPQGRYLVPDATYTASALCHACTEEVQRSPIVTFNASQTRTGCAFNEQVLAFVKFFDAYRLDSVRVEKDGCM